MIFFKLGCANGDEQMRKRWPFSLLNDEQMGNKVGVEHQPVFRKKKSFRVLGSIEFHR